MVLMCYIACKLNHTASSQHKDILPLELSSFQIHFSYHGVYIVYETINGQYVTRSVIIIILLLLHSQFL